MGWLRAGFREDMHRMGSGWQAEVTTESVSQFCLFLVLALVQELISSWPVRWWLDILLEIVIERLGNQGSS